MTDSALATPFSTSAHLLSRYLKARQQTEKLCEPLEVEDYVIQSMPDVSPTKWHLAHTTWFFESFVLAKAQPHYQPYQPEYAFLFNSYYVTKGDRHARPNRGLLSRPTVADIYAYRAAVDDAIAELLSQSMASELANEVAELIILGLNHEQQHQELMLMDIKHVLATNPLKPVYQVNASAAPPLVAELEWMPVIGGVYEIGHHPEAGFCFDNETPRHRVFLDDFAMANRKVTNAEWLQFIQDGGYETPTLWLSDGWDWLQHQPEKAPLYWRQACDNDWVEFTLGGERPLQPDAPVAHISFYEAEAYATWAGARLPSEAEWEVASVDGFVAGQPDGPFVESENYHPVGARFGDAWEWTRANYAPYPGYKPLPGSLGEYNGKFMNNQYVLRGGSCATPQDHLRLTYRNFFAPHMRWQFSGLRLVKAG